MTRTADRLLAGALQPGARREPLVKLAQRTVARQKVIVADNVASFVRAQNKEWVLEDEFPSLAPPWPFFWIEYPNEGTQRRGVLVMDLWPLTVMGDAYLRGQLDDDPGWREVIELVMADHEAHPGTNRTGIYELGTQAVEDARRQSQYADAPGWILGMVLFMEVDKELTPPVGWMGLCLDERGRAVGNRWQVRPEMMSVIPEDMDGGSWLQRILHPALQTVAFLHCRNVQTDTVTPAPKLSRAHQKRTGVPLLRYQTVRLQVPRRSSAGGATSASSSSMSLHIVAGHFAHYGDCGCPPEAHPPRGKLFGKHEGVFWVPDHLRGDATVGEVRTDVEVVVKS